MADKQVYLYQESHKLKKILSENERLNSHGGRGYVVSGAFICNSNISFPRDYFDCLLDENEQSQLIKLTNGEFVAFKK